MYSPWWRPCRGSQGRACSAGMPTRAVGIWPKRGWWNAEAAYVWERAMGLRLRGHEVSILGLPGSPLLEKAAHEGFTVLAEAGLNSMNPLSWAGAYRRLRRRIRLDSFDVVDAHDGHCYVVDPADGGPGVVVGFELGEV